MGVRKNKGNVVAHHSVLVPGTKNVQDSFGFHLTIAIVVNCQLNAVLMQGNFFPLLIEQIESTGIEEALVGF